MVGNQGAPPPQVVVPGQGWVDVASRAIVQVGFPVVVAGVLLWFLLGKFQSNMEMIVDRMGHNTQAATALIEGEAAHLRELQAQTAELRSQSQAMRDIAAKLDRLLERQRQGGGS